MMVLMMIILFAADFDSFAITSVQVSNDFEKNTNIKTDAGG